MTDEEKSLDERIAEYQKNELWQPNEMFQTTVLIDDLIADRQRLEFELMRCKAIIFEALPNIELSAPDKVSEGVKRLIEINEKLENALHSTTHSTTTKNIGFET